MKIIYSIFVSILTIIYSPFFAVFAYIIIPILILGEYSLDDSPNKNSSNEFKNMFFENFSSPLKFFKSSYKVMDEVIKEGWRNH